MSLKIRNRLFVIFAFFAVCNIYADAQDEDFEFSQDLCTEEPDLFVEEAKEETLPQNICDSNDCRSEKRWYFEVQPGVFFFTDSEMRHFFGDHPFTCRGEFGYRLCGPLTIWVDGSYLQASGKAIGGHEKIELKLATMTLGLKWVQYFNDAFAFYAGAGPRLFMMMLDNDSLFVRGTDNEIGIGGGFDAGFWIFPVPKWPNFFFDLYSDYSWKKMNVDPDEISSRDHDVNISGLSVGLGLGIRF